jgi:hypothetical protein
VFWFNECCCCRRMEFSLAAVHTVPTPAAACCQCHAPSAASCWWPALELAAAFPLDWVTGRCLCHTHHSSLAYTPQLYKGAGRGCAALSHMGEERGCFGG